VANLQCENVIGNGCNLTESNARREEKSEKPLSLVEREREREKRERRLPNINGSEKAES